MDRPTAIDMAVDNWLDARPDIVFVNSTTVTDEVVEITGSNAEGTMFMGVSPLWGYTIGGVKVEPDPSWDAFGAKLAARKLLESWNNEYVNERVTSDVTAERVQAESTFTAYDVPRIG